MATKKAVKKAEKPMPKLGKQPARNDPRTLHLHNYIDIKKLPKAPFKASMGKQHTQMGGNEEFSY